MAQDGSAELFGVNRASGTLGETYYAAGKEFAPFVIPR